IATNGLSRTGKASETRAGSAEVEFQEEGARDGICAVRGDRDEAERAVERDRLLHGRERVEPHARVADRLRLRDDPLRQSAARLSPAALGAHVETLHLTHGVLQRS